VKFNLPETEAYKRFYQENVDNVLSVNQEFLQTEGMINNVWKRPNFENRHVYTKFSCDGFHFLVIKNKEFHDGDENCICEL